MNSIERRAAAIIAAYDRQGWHRTGTEVDRSSAEWLAAEVAAAGLEPSLESFQVECLDPLESYLAVEGYRVPGCPAFDGGTTGSAGIAATLTLDPARAGILLLRTSVAGPGPELQAARLGGKADAIVAVIDGGGEQPLRNADRFRDPFGPPVLQVDPRTWDRLHAAAARGAPARAVVAARRRPGWAQNVLLEIPGEAPRARPLVVMTPRSGWWQCASERGGGLVCWLEALRAIPAARPQRPVLLLATSGHELGHLGLEDFISRRPELAAEASCWVHLGANIGAATGDRLSVRSSEAGLCERAAALLAGCEFPFPMSTNPPGSVVGEAANIAAAGGRFVSLIGNSALFHTRQDRWPAAVNIDAVSRAAGAVVALVVELARTEQ